MTTAYREIDNRVLTPRLAAELIAVAVTAGAAALFVKHEQGASPFLKAKKHLIAATLGAAILAVLALSKATNDKKGTKFSILGAALGVAAATGAFLLIKRNEPKYLTSGGGPDVFKAQYGLVRLGYPITITGQIDAATTQSLKNFQATYSLLVQDGTLTPETVAYIDQVSAQYHAPAFTPDTGYHAPLTTQT